MLPVLALVLLLAGCAASAPPAPPAAAVPSDGVYGRAAFIGAVMELLHEKYADADAANYDALMTGALKGMLRELDPYGDYTPPAASAAFRTQLTGDGVGVGMTVVKKPGADLLVTGVLPRSPAAEAGIRPGDRVLEVNARRMRDLPLEDFLAAVKGSPGTDVMLKIQRPGAEDPTLYKLTRKAFVITPVPPRGVRRLAGDIGYIRIERFSRPAAPAVAQAVRKLQSGGPLKGLILDLRGNPGGIVDSAVETVSQFLPENTVVFRSVGRDAAKVSEVRTRRHAAPLRDLPMAVLINEFTASSAEIMTGALKDHGRAVVVGARSFGKGAIQQLQMLPNGGSVRYTSAHYRTPAGHQIDGRGIVPDVEVKVSTRDTFLLMRAMMGAGKGPAIPDRALEKAAALLREGRDGK